MNMRISVLLVCLLMGFHIGSRADNVVTLSSENGESGTEVTVSVSLTNTDVVSSIQLSIPLNESLALVEGAAQAGTRCSGHNVSVGVKNDVLNIMVYSMSLAAISGNSGVVATFRLKLGDKPGDISLTPSQVVLLDANGGDVMSTAQGGTVTIIGACVKYTYSELNFDRIPIRTTSSRSFYFQNTGNANLVITGLLFSDVNIFSTDTSFPMTIEPGVFTSFRVNCTPTEAGRIERTMTVLCNSSSTQNTIKLKAQAYSVNELRVESASGNAGDEVTISLTMNNMDAVSGLQLEFDMPTSLQYVDGSFALSGRKQDHVAMGSLVDGVLRIVAYSPTDKPFTGNEGEIASFKVKLAGRNNVYFGPTKTVLSATINNATSNVVSATSVAYIQILSPQISASSTLDMGEVATTEKCEKSFTIRNNGGAPLVISRVDFGAEGFSIKETLPLTILAYQTKDITVVHTTEVETEIATFMHVFSNDPEKQLCEVQLTGTRFSPNYLNVSVPSVKSTENLSIDITMNNHDAITGIQFDLIYPKDYYAPFDNNCTLAERAKGMTVTAMQMDEQTLRYFCYFITGGSLRTGNGKVMTIELKPVVNDVPLGNYSLQVKNIKLGTADMADKYAGADMNVSFRVANIIKGDVNGDGDVDIADAVCIVNHVVGKTNTSFNAAAADVNGDGDVDIADAVRIVNLVVGKINALSRPAMRPEQDEKEPQ